MEENENSVFKLVVCVVFGIIGVCLIGSSFFVSGVEAHQLFSDITQLIMLIAGSVSILVAVVIFFIRNSPDIWM